MPKIINVEQRKRVISEKALQVFIQDGFQNAQLARIAEECRIGRTTIYQYFKSKHDLYKTVMDKVSERVDREYQAIIEDATLSAFDKIRIFIHRILEGSLQRRDLLIIMIDPGLASDQKVDTVDVRYRHARNFQKKFRHLLEDGIKAGDIRDLNPRTTAFVLYSLIASLLVNHRFLGNWPLSEVEKSIDLLLESLKNPLPSRISSIES